MNRPAGEGGFADGPDTSMTAYARASLPGGDRIGDTRHRQVDNGRIINAVPPIDELTRIEPVYLDRLAKQGVFTTGILLEVSETPTRRQSLADHVGATINDVATWRDEALMLNLASFGPTEHQLLIQAGIRGLQGIVDLDLPAFKECLVRPALQLGLEPVSDLRAEGWWDQARTLEDE